MVDLLARMSNAEEAEFREVAFSVTRPQDGNVPKKTPAEGFQKLSEIPDEKPETEELSTHIKT